MAGGAFTFVVTFRATKSPTYGIMSDAKFAGGMFVNVVLKRSYRVVAKLLFGMGKVRRTDGRRT